MFLVSKSLVRPSSNTPSIRPDTKKLSWISSFSRQATNGINKIMCRPTRRRTRVNGSWTLFWKTLQFRQLGFGSWGTSPEPRSLSLGFFSCGHACRSVSSRQHRSRFINWRRKYNRRNSKCQCGRVENYLKTSLNVVPPPVSPPVGNIFNIYFKNLHIFAKIKEFLQFLYILVSFLMSH